MIALAKRVSELPRLDVAHRELPTLPCPDCGRRLSLDQPDADMPTRLLGVCGRCHAWFQVDVAGRGRG